ncbi:MAG: hypothetical protein F6J93_19050 [Oscillatoria sp. SIO1A7]|nr:hypothetical protein [Oscillatoria sp. SIO1A7]
MVHIINLQVPTPHTPHPTPYTPHPTPHTPHPIWGRDRTPELSCDRGPTRPLAISSRSQKKNF